MGKYLDILAREEVYDINDQNDQSRPTAVLVDHEAPPRTLFCRISRFGRTFSALEARCPDLVQIDHWQQAVEDGRRFLTKWDEQAEALGWTARDLFGLAAIPDKPHPSYRRLSRYDESGLIWLLRGRPVLALTEATAAVASPTGAVTVYRRHNKPAHGPLGDSLDDFR